MNRCLDRNFHFDRSDCAISITSPLRAHLLRGIFFTKRRRALTGDQFPRFRRAETPVRPFAADFQRHLSIDPSTRTRSGSRHRPRLLHDVTLGPAPGFEAKENRRFESPDRYRQTWPAPEKMLKSLRYRANLHYCRPQKLNDGHAARAKRQYSW